MSEKDGLKISILANVVDNPWEDGDVPIRYITLNTSGAFISIAIQNTSDKPIRIFQESNSVGYSDLVLEVTNVNNQVLPKPIVVSRHGGTWFVDYPASKVIEPGTVVVRKMQFFIPIESPGVNKNVSPPMYLYGEFPIPDLSTSKQITMRAVFSNEVAFGLEKEPIWTGQIASKPLEYKVSLVDDRPKPKPN